MVVIVMSEKADLSALLQISGGYRREKKQPAALPSIWLFKEGNWGEIIFDRL